MAGKKTGVYPVYENQFQVNTGTAATSEDGTSITGGTFSNIADMESFSVSFDNGVEEWTPFDQAGWTRRLMTSKSITISVSGKRNVADAGNDFISNKAFKNGRDAEVDIQWTFPDGTKVVFLGAVINITEFGAGDSTNVAPLAFDVMSNGKPIVVPAV